MNINSFDHGVELGKQLALPIFAQMHGEDASEQDPATRHLIDYYRSLIPIDLGADAVQGRFSVSELYPVPADIKARTLMDEATYQRLYTQSVEDPDKFWAEQANTFLTWEKSWHTVSQADIPNGNVAWFDGAQLNVSTNCIDRHLPQRADQTAIIWEGDDPADDQKISYQELYDRVCQLANGLRQRGVGKGDRVCIYMPMIPEAAYAMLACARIGAIHSVVFGGFSPQSLKDRILDSDCQTVITADEGVRGGKSIPWKANTDEALQDCPNVHTVVTVKRTGGDIEWVEGRDVWYDR